MYVFQCSERLRLNGLTMYVGSGVAYPKGDEGEHVSRRFLTPMNVDENVV